MREDHAIQMKSKHPSLVSQSIPPMLLKIFQTLTRVQNVIADRSTPIGPQGSSKIDMPTAISQRDIFRNETIEHDDILIKRDIVAQPDIPGREMSFISQAPRTSIFDVKGYLYDERVGQGITVYLLDTGANTKNMEWASMAMLGRWLWPENSI